MRTSALYAVSYFLAGQPFTDAAAIYDLDLQLFILLLILLLFNRIYKVLSSVCMYVSVSVCFFCLCVVCLLAYFKNQVHFLI